MPAEFRDQQVPRSQEVFISYSRKDKEFVRRLDEELKRRGREAWVDWEGIPPGDTWEKTIYGAIEASNTFIFVLTPDSIASEICGKEIAHAAANNKRLVPVVHRDVAADRVPKSLGELNWIFCRDSDDFGEATETLVRALDTDLSWVRAHTRLLARAIEWDTNGRNNSFVLRGDDLRSAERWLAEAGAQKERQPTALQTEYIIASRKAAARRQRIALGAVALGAVVAIILAVVAFIQRGEARKQEAKAKTTSVQADFDLAVLYQKQSDSVDPRTLAHLARALRTQPNARLPRQYLVSLLRDSPWFLAQMEPMRHEGIVKAASFSSDGRPIVVTASFDKTARVWDAESGKPVGEPMRHESFVYAASFSPDGRRIVTSSYDKTARVWDTESGKPVGEPMRHEGIVKAASFSPDGRRIVTASFDKTARVWDTESGKSVGEPMRHESAVNAASFSPDGRRIVTASYDKTARVWDAESGKPVGEPIRHESYVYAASFSPDGRRIVTGSFNKTARVWDAESGKPVGESMRHGDVVLAASFSPDGRRIVTGSEDKTARVWDAESGKPVGEPMRHEAGINAASFSPDGRRIVTGSIDKTVRVWDADSGKPVREPMHHEDVVNDASFSPDGRWIVTASADKTARVWDVAVDLETPLPEWGPELAEALGQRRFNEEGLLVSPKKSVGELRRELLTLKGDDFWSRLGRWFFMRGPQRTISPDSKITVGEFTRQQFQETTQAKPTKQ